MRGRGEAMHNGGLAHGMVAPAAQRARLLFLSI